MILGPQMCWWANLFALASPGYYGYLRRKLALGFSLVQLGMVREMAYFGLIFAGLTLPCPNSDDTPYIVSGLILCKNLCKAKLGHFEFRPASSMDSRERTIACPGFGLLAVCGNCEHIIYKRF